MGIEELRAYCFDLFQLEGGKLIRIKSTSSNSRCGDVAGWWDDRTGYYKVRIKSKPYLIHRIIFLMVNGYLPDLVDHIDGDTKNNNPSNLREATKKQNRWNSNPNKGSISGIKGVYYDRGRWKALINVNGSRIYLGMFDTIEGASEKAMSEYVKHHNEFYKESL